MIRLNLKFINDNLIWKGLDLNNKIVKRHNREISNGIKEIISKITSIPFALLKKSIMIGYPFSYHSKPKNQ